MRPFLAHCRTICTVLAVAAVSACAAPPVTETINDPFEEQNRRVHDFNKAVDTKILKPLTGGGNSSGETGPVMRSVGNFAGNLDMPRVIVNDVLQAKPQDATSNLVRFMINSTFGIAGIFDPATAWGLPERKSDFGETLHVWGVSEGAYVELPLFVPSTSRDTAGRVVDAALNPLSYVIPAPERAVIPVSRVAGTLSSRSENSEFVDDVLYNSADSYTQARLLYLQNRRFQLGQTVETEEADPFALDTEGF